MKKTNIQLVLAGLAVLLVTMLASCSKDQQNKSTVAQDNNLSDATDAGGWVAYWKFDSTWKEAVSHANGKPYWHAKFSSTPQAKAGKADYLSPDSGYVYYSGNTPNGADLQNTLANLTSGFTVDFWVYAIPGEGGARSIFAVVQDGQFWPQMHVITDGWNPAKGDTGYFKLMFKANKSIDYNERWNDATVPKFYNRWSHIQFSYDGATSKLTLIVNNKVYRNHEVQYTDASNTTKLGNLNPNPSPKGVVIGDFQNKITGASRETWMQYFKGRIDNLKIYDHALF